MNEAFADPPERPSKSQRKREMHARQDLGEQLVRLASDALRRLQLPETLHDAVVAAQRIKAHEARRRQLQYIGKLMRDVDCDSIQAALDELTGASRQSVALMHRCERLRDQLLEDDAALAAFLQEHPGVDVQWLRAKLRAARQERAGARPPRHARELYQWLHGLLRPGTGAEPAAAPDAAARGERP